MLNVTLIKKKEGKNEKEANKIQIEEWNYQEGDKLLC